MAWGIGVFFGKGGFYGHYLGWDYVLFVLIFV